MRTQVARRLNAPVASSAGRLFDAAAALLGLRDVAEYEAQAAIDLEIAAGDRRADPLPWRLDRVDGLLVYDPRPTLAALLAGRADGRRVGPLAAAFHETIAEVTRELVAAAAGETGLRTVCLSGGVFQNRRLASTLLRRLAGDGFRVLVNRRVPVNDGGISYGQAAIAAARLAARGPPAPAAPPATPEEEPSHVPRHPGQGHRDPRRRRPADGQGRLRRRAQGRLPRLHPRGPARRLRDRPRRLRDQPGRRGGGAQDARDPGDDGRHGPPGAGDDGTRDGRAGGRLRRRDAGRGRVGGRWRAGRAEPAPGAPA